jgi:hypothetical protein
MAKPLVVSKTNKAKNALIKRAVYDGRGWRYAHEGPKAIKYRTPGGLTPSNLMVNKAGQVVSKAKHAAGRRLQAAGYGADPFTR